MAATASSILVTGGTGSLGRPVVERLLDTGLEVRVLSRRQHSGAEKARRVWMVGDLRTGAGIDAAVTGVDAIIHCATTNGGGDVAATGRLVDAARRAGEAHLVYISIVGVDRVPLPYYRAKLAAESLIESCGLPWTVQRATQFHDLIMRLCAVQRRTPAVVMPAFRVQPVDVTEVAARVTELATGEPALRVPDMGGPEVREAAELARAYLRATSSRRPVLAARLPGKIFRAYRRGGHLTPQHAVGRITFDDYLAAREH